MALLIFFIVLGLSSAAYLFLKLIARPKNQHYWNGPRPSRRQEKKNKEQVFSLIEEFPNGTFAKDNPHYVDDYLETIDLDLPSGIITAQ